MKNAAKEQKEMKQTNEHAQGFLPAIYIYENENQPPLGEYGRELLRNLREKNPDRYWQLTLEGALMPQLHQKERELREKKLLLVAELERQFPRPRTESMFDISRHMGMLSDQADEVIRKEISNIEI